MRSRSLSRRSATINPAVKFTIYSEGMNTEPEYFEQLDRDTPNALVSIKIVPAAGAPITIAQTALELRRSQRRRRKDLSSYEENDQIWVIFDRDAHDKVKESVDNLKANRIGVAYTNPCFEVWLILHFEDFDKPIDRHATQKYLETLCPDYQASRAKKTDCSKLMAQIPLAEARAIKMNQRRVNEGASMHPPWCTVYELTQAIRKAASRK